MTKELLQQALEVLESVVDGGYYDRDDYWVTSCQFDLGEADEAIAALQAAIAQPEQQPLTPDEVDAIWESASEPDKPEMSVHKFAELIQATAQPAGMCLVPLEPTQEMLDAAGEVDGQPDRMSRSIYSAMIAAHNTTAEQLCRPQEQRGVYEPCI